MMSSDKPDNTDIDENLINNDQKEHHECPVTTPIVVVGDGVRALEWYPKALGGRATYRCEVKGKIMHAVITTDYGLNLGLEDHFPEEHVDMIRLGEKGTSYIYVTIPKGKGTADKAIDRMREAGAKIVEEATDKFYGHRSGKVVDIFGATWIFAHEI